MPHKSLQAKDLLKTTGIIQSRPQETLSSSLAKLRSSGDAVFVFDQKERFLGVINPYYVLFKRNFPGEAKVKNCLFSPPRLALTSEIWDIAKLMLEAKIYFLPVFDQKDVFAGIVSFNRILQSVRENKGLVKKLKLETKKETVTIGERATLGELFFLMRKKKVSRIPVVNGSNHLVGIVSRHDLRMALSVPVQSPRFLSRRGDKRKYLNQPIGNYYKRKLVTVFADTPPEVILDRMLENDIGSLVVTDNSREPLGIISNHDVLKAIVALRPSEEPQIEVKFEGDFSHKDRAKQIFFKFINKTKKLYPMSKGEFIFTILENRAGLPSRYKTRLKLSLKSGRQIASKLIGYKWRETLKNALGKIKRQLERG